ncbi:MAG: serine hydroxymethyltransferase [Dethiosulfovibrio peptidovorans]|nr:MAG: serine hydroxymethyltransferase [Dethiosulfovibrio peptidovorans]
MGFSLKDDQELYDLITAEGQRQRDCLDMVASQSLAPRAVLEVSGSCLSNRTIEGYPGKRYYAGGRFLDGVERLAIERARKLFGAEHVNVQPHCGTNTNLAVYQAVLTPGDTILSMDMASGGHLSHGHKLNVASRMYNFVHYGVRRDDEILDGDQLREQALRHRPRLIVAGGSSYPREIDWKTVRSAADQVGAMVMADVAHTAGLIAAGLHVNPVPFCDFVTFSLYKTLPGPRGGCILCRESYGDAVDRAIFPGHQGSMLTSLMGAKATCFAIAASAEFKDIAGRIIENARVLASSLNRRGYRPVTGGTDSHIVLLDLRTQGITGKEAESLLEASGITVNRNGIPFDPLKPWIASGIRLGTTVAAMRGMGPTEMETVAELIHRSLSGEPVGAETTELCRRFPESIL